MTTPAAIEAHLLARWAEVLPSAPDVGRELVARYAEPARRYHDQRHLSEVLAHVDELTSYAHDPDTVRLAAWFHDAIYDPHRPDNEEASARLAEELLAGAGVGSQRVAEVGRLVRITVRHDADSADVDAAVLCDADLAILASGPERYGQYAAGVRAEYAHVDDPAFRRGRAEVLEGLLGRAALFHTPYGHHTWEVIARHNLTAELALLRG